ncbi:peptidase S15, partial [Mycobacterium sp. ITM-2017-0098]
DGELVWRETMQWLDRYVKGDESIDPGPQFEWVDQHGDHFSSEGYPVTAGESITAMRDTDQAMAFIPFIGGSGPNPLIITRGLVQT